MKDEFSVFRNERYTEIRMSHVTSGDQPHGPLGTRKNPKRLVVCVGSRRGKCPSAYRGSDGRAGVIGRVFTGAESRNEAEDVSSGSRAPAGERHLSSVPFPAALSPFFCFCFVYVALFSRRGSRILISIAE